MYAERIKKYSRNAMAAIVAGVAYIAFTTVARADVGHLMPKVKELTVGDGILSLSSPLTINDLRQTPALALYLNDCGASLTRKGEAAGIPVAVEYVDEIPGAFRHDFVDWPNEEYTLSITPEALVKIIAANPAGVCNYCDDVPPQKLDVLTLL